MSNRSSCTRLHVMAQGARALLPRLPSLVLTLVLWHGGLKTGSPAAAQTDLRQIKPFLSVIVDSSGSMERLPNCVCQTRACNECLPDCDLSNDAQGKPPAGKKNRWAVTLEALTGTFEDFTCRTLARESNNGMTYDLNYYLPYHQPWSCSSSDIAGGRSCKAFPESSVSHALYRQLEDGILDTYSGRVRFGMATFDGWGTYQGEAPLIIYDQFSTSRNRSTEGLWSYGSYDSSGLPIRRPDGRQPGRFRYPNCATDYMIDTGIRGPQAAEGSLVSLNSCDNPPCDPLEINDRIQRSLLDARPYGGTPIAAALDDLYYHLSEELGSDTFGSCRSRYGLLITDGYPDDDFRSLGCDCTQNSDPTAAGYCGGGSNNPQDMFCPYPRPEEVAYDLVTGRAGSGQQDSPPLKRLFVVGLSVADPDVKARLNLIAQQGNSPEQSDGNYALFADDNDPLTDDLETLRKTIDAVVSQTIEPISRSVPALVSGRDAAQYQISTGFDIGTRGGDPWNGFIERRRFTCSGNVLQEEVISSEDQFHQTLKNQASRSLLSVEVQPSQANGPISGNDPLATCSDHCPLAELGGGVFLPAHFGLATGDTSGRDAILQWMYGTGSDLRGAWPLGDVYHSSPVVLTAPQTDQGDEAYSLFRQLPVIANRPSTLFVNTNDGLLHAFAIEAWSDPLGTRADLYAGQELWAFVPPLLLDDLEYNLTSHQLTLDGTPVIKDVYFQRDVSAVVSGQEYHTVLVTGMRDGGDSYIALDVTDIHEPKFLWQFNHDNLGNSYGQAALTQANFKLTSAAGSPVKHGAVAILPGGQGQRGTAADCFDEGGVKKHLSFRGLSNTPWESLVEAGNYNNTHAHRGELPCWEEAGRSLFFVDVETGLLIKELDSTIFPSPLIGSPVVFSDDIGTKGKRAFVLDADGVLWRVDLSSSDVEPDDPLRGWTARPFHDLFYDRPYDGGQVSFERPLVTMDPSGNPVVLVGTGNTDDFEDDDAINRVVSLTEAYDSTRTGVAEADHYTAIINWELRETTGNHDGFEPSELVTGSMALHDGQLYFASYISVPPEDPCDMGLGRFWSLHYREADTAQPTGADPPTYGPLRIAEEGFNVSKDEATPDLLVQGIALTQRPTCAQQSTVSDTIFGQYQSIEESAPAATYLVAQAAGSGATKVAGSSLGMVQMQIQSRRSPAVITSWAGTVE